MQFDYSYTVIDPGTGCARTFTVRTENRQLAHRLITHTVRRVNRDRLAANPAAKLIPTPEAMSLDAASNAAPASGAGHVRIYA